MRYVPWENGDVDLSISISNSPVTLHDGGGSAFAGFRDPDVLDFLFRPYCENGDWIAHEDC
jgi:hypothetical protein